MLCDVEIVKHENKVNAIAIANFIFDSDLLDLFFKEPKYIPIPTFYS